MKAKKNVSYKIPEDLDFQVREAAASMGTSASELVREALSRYLEVGAGAPPRNFVAAAGKLIGSVKGGPSDLATNKKYLDDLGK